MHCCPALLGKVLQCVNFVSTQDVLKDTTHALVALPLHAAVTLSCGTRKPAEYYTNWPGHPWARFTASLDPEHTLQNSRKPKGKPREGIPGDFAQRHFLQCAECAACVEVAGNNKAVNGAWIEPKEFWTGKVLKKHEELSSHVAAVKANAARDAVNVNGAESDLGNIASSLQRATVVAAEHKDNAEKLEAERVSQRAENERHVAFQQRASLVRTTLKLAWNGQALSHMTLEVETAAANGAEVPKASDYGSHATAHGSKNLTVFMSDISKEEIADNLRDAVFWGLVSDGSSDRAMKHAVGIVVMWINRDGSVHCNLWDINECGGSAAAQFAMLKQEFDDAGVDWDLCIGGSFDGASVNFGRRSGLAVRISNLAAFALFCHCCGHRVALCSKAAAKKSTFAANHLKTMQRMFRRYCWSGLRRDELREVCEELGIKYLAPKLIMDIRFLSCAAVTATCNKTLKGHISKAFRDINEQLSTSEFMDEHTDLPENQRVRVTAANVCNEAGNGRFVFANPVFAAILDKEKIFAVQCQTRLGGDGNRDGTIGEIPALVRGFRASLQKYLDRPSDEWESFDWENQPAPFTIPPVTDFRIAGDTVSVKWATSDDTSVMLALSTPDSDEDVSALPAARRKAMYRATLQTEIVRGVREYVECFLTEFDDRFPASTMHVYGAFGIFDFHSVEWDSFSEGRNADFGLAEIKVLKEFYGEERHVPKPVFEVGDNVSAPFLRQEGSRKVKRMFSGVVQNVNEELGVIQIKWSDSETTDEKPNEMEGLVNDMKVRKEPLVDCRRIEQEWRLYRDEMVAKNVAGAPLFKRSGKSKRLMLQSLLGNTARSGRFRNVLRLMMIEAVSVSNSMQAERVFSAHNVVKTSKRNGLDTRTAAAQCRLHMMKQELEPMGSERCEAYVHKVVRCIEEDEGMMPKFKVDMTRFDAQRAHEEEIKQALRAELREEVRDELRTQMRPLVHEQLMQQLTPELTQTVKDSLRIELAPCITGELIASAVREALPAVLPDILQSSPHAPPPDDIARLALTQQRPESTPGPAAKKQCTKAPTTALSFHSMFSMPKKSKKKKDDTIAVD